MNKQEKYIIGLLTAGKDKEYWHILRANCEHKFSPLKTKDNTIVYYCEKCTLSTSIGYDIK